MKLKYVSVILWALCILLATNTYNFQTMLFARDIGFNIRLFPDPLDFFITSDIELNSKSYVFQKIGHAISFGILFLLINRSIGDSKKAFIFSSLFALFTEFLQLFFERSGRLSDVVIDMAGIYLAFRLVGYVKRQGGLDAALKKLKSAFFERN